MPLGALEAPRRPRGRSCDVEHDAVADLARVRGGSRRPRPSRRPRRRRRRRAARGPSRRACTRSRAAHRERLRARSSSSSRIALDPGGVVGRRRDRAPARRRRGRAPRSRAAGTPRVDERRARGRAASSTSASSAACLPGAHHASFALSALCWSTASRSSRPVSSTMRSRSGSDAAPTSSATDLHPVGLGEQRDGARRAARPTPGSPCSACQRATCVDVARRRLGPAHAPGSGGRRRGRGRATTRVRTKRRVCAVTGSAMSPPGRRHGAEDRDRPDAAGERLHARRALVERRRASGARLAG